MRVLSLRKSPCIREHCAACESGEGHPSYVLYTSRRGRRGALYVPDALAAELRAAIAHVRPPGPPAPRPPSLRQEAAGPRPGAGVGGPLRRAAPAAQPEDV